MPQSEPILIAPPAASAPKTAEAPAELMLTPPGNSTLELRVARRPWLLEKLVPSDDNRSPKPSLPSARELPDPPSMSVLPPSAQQRPTDVVEDGWQRRGHADPSPSRGETAMPPQSSLRLIEPSPARIAPPETRLQPQPPSAKARPTQSLSMQAHSPEPRIQQPVYGSPATPPYPRSQPAERIPLTDPPRMADVARRMPANTLAKPAEQKASPEPARPEPSRSARVSDLDEPSPRNRVTDDQGDNEGDNVATLNAPEEAAASTPDSVTIRKLQIDRYGNPVAKLDGGEADDAPAVGSIGDLPSYGEPSKTETLKAEPPKRLQAVPIEDRSLSLHRIDEESDDRALDQDIETLDANDEPRPDVDYAGFPKESIRPSATVAQMQRMMQACLTYYHDRAEVANERSNWGMMHSIMVYGIDTQVIVDRKKYSTIAWIAGNNACRGQRLLEENDGRIVVKSGVGLQGHQAQMLAVFSLCDVPLDYPMYAAGTKFALADVVREEQLACKSGEELTFTLIGLSHYMDTDTVWNSEDGQRWDFQRLIREELSQPIVGAACGGTHRLMGFGHALRKRRAEGKPIEGQWLRAEKFVEDFVAYTYRLQNRDGSMSTNWFEGREDNDDLDRKVQTTGHMVEWLLTVTPDSQLQNPRLVSAIKFLLTSLYKDRNRDWAIGPKGHALRSLAMYYDRVYQSGPAWRTQQTARSSGTSPSRR